jgi:hypothetical protein
MNSSALPSTINHPGAFARSPSAGFDGVTDWLWLENGVHHVRGIKPTDVDGAVGVKHFFLYVETKDVGVEPTIGQRRFINDQIDLGLYTAIYVWGKREPTSWQWQNFVETSERFTEAYGGGTMLDDMETFARGWINFNDARSEDYWRTRLIEAALKGAPSGLKRELIAKLSS